MIQKLGVGAIYYNAKSEILRRVKERKGKVTIIESIPPPPLFWITETAFEELLSCCNCDSEKVGGGGWGHLLQCKVVHIKTLKVSPLMFTDECKSQIQHLRICPALPKF